MVVGKSVPRVDGYEKVTGRAKYTDDLVGKDALVAKILHSTIANGLVKSMDTSEAEKIPGVVKIVTCFDVPNIPFPTAGHPWSTDPNHQDPADRLLLNRRVRLYGDDIAAVIAEDEVAASRALRAIKVEYEEYPFVLSPEEAMKDGAPVVHDEVQNNILGHTKIENGDFEEAIKEPGLIKVESVYETPIVQHCHIEVPVSYAYMEQGRITVVASTQIPHIVRRIVGQALGLPWGKVRIIKPYIGGGFGNKQDALYEPLNAFLTTQVGGRLVKLELSREETFFGTRVRHAIKFYTTAYLRPDGQLVARDLKAYSNQGAYGSHGHSILSKALTSFRQLYRDEKAVRVEGWTVYTNMATAGAMRGYGTPQSVFCMEAMAEDCARVLGMDPLEYRRKNMMPVGFQDPFSKNINYYDSFNQCLAKGMEYIEWDKKRELYKNQTGPIRRGVGVSLFWYNTAVWPISLEISSCRMVLNQDGSIQLQVAETEIGQGADTAYAQMAAETLGIDYKDVHVISTQDTDVTPFGLGAYGSRQTYVAGMAIRQTAEMLKEKILKFAYEYTRMQPYNMDIVDGNIVWKTRDNQVLMSLGELATEVLYSTIHSSHLTAESTAQCKSNAYSFGCAFAEVEVDLPLGKVKLLDLINVHDCGTLINPQLAAAQVHGGMSMSIGFGLSEQLLYDEKTGKPLNDNLLDYKLSTMMDHPHLEAQFVENPEPTSAYGTKALGEPPTVPAAPAIRNAVLNATGVAINTLPLNPHHLIPAFKEAGLI
ncbi:xanthine dehydrogenase, molybdenum binding subunit [uncultured Eubacteriales bacterium]|uniref:Xanthine dehydrogenase, molybdenum binding subunit n=1 Tax=uncultured Eubacteriales bacterium TaxID=172733 RepID=A0A212KLY9_9FIRM|nr:xanthine dehydrogenase, molybdenum binding subunit [uncultured Eubacteriales bacterium]